MKTCKTCKYWRGDEGAFSTCQLIGEEGDEAFKFIWVCDLHRAPFDAPPDGILIGYETQQHAVYMGHAFGCIHHEPNHAEEE